MQKSSRNNLRIFPNRLSLNIILQKLCPQCSSLWEEDLEKTNLGGTSSESSNFESHWLADSLCRLNKDKSTVIYEVRGLSAWSLPAPIAENQRDRYIYKWIERYSRQNESNLHKIIVRWGPKMQKIERWFFD